MALNPPLLAYNPVLGTSLPVPFENEILLLTRQSVVFEVDKIPGVPKNKVHAKGTIHLSNIRVVFVAKKPVGNFVAFDMPLLYIYDERFKQPIFLANKITGEVHPVIPDGAHRALYFPHDFKIIFKNGGCGTFVPLFFSLLKSARQYQPNTPVGTGHGYTDPLPISPPPTEEIMHHAYVDPNDPSKIYLDQPMEGQNHIRRRTYAYVPSDDAQY